MEATAEALGATVEALEVTQQEATHDLEATQPGLALGMADACRMCLNKSKIMLRLSRCLGRLTPRETGKLF